jgi:RNA-directed DNA polymerase
VRREGHLFERIFAFDTLLEAFWRARRRAAASEEVRAFEQHLFGSLARLQRQAWDGTLELGRFRSFEICDPKRRRIHAPVFEERVVHHAVCSVIGPRIERSLIDRTFACRKGLGTHAALGAARTLARTHPFVAKLDVRGYFDSIDHDALLARLERLFKDAQLLRLLERIVRSYEVAAGRGIPIGSLCSQTFGNLYLAPFDRAASADPVVGAYLRYMDDALVFGDSKVGVARSARAAMAATGELGLAWKTVQVFAVARGFPFLGWRIDPHGARLTAARKRRARARLRGLGRAWGAGRIDERAYARRLESSFAHVAGERTRALRRAWIEGLDLDAGG